MEKSKSKSKVQFIGPRALFDKSFVPPKVYGQKKMVEDFRGYLKDFSEDGLSCITSVSGNQGTGKKLLTRRTLNSLSKEAKMNTELLLIECEKKNIVSLLTDLIGFFVRIHKKQVKDELILNASIDELWNLVQQLSDNLAVNSLIMFDSAESIDRRLMKKMIALAKKRTKMNLLFSFNISGSTMKMVEIYNCDKNIQMPEFKNSELYSITKDRADMAFKSGLPTPMLAFVVDSVKEFGAKNPGSCVDFLKEIYPTIYANNEISADEARFHARYHFELKMMDSISIADFIMDSNMTERIFLDNMITCFKEENLLYASFNKIEEAYNMTGELLEFKPEKNELFSLVEKFMDNYIICRVRQ